MLNTGMPKDQLVEYAFRSRAMAAAYTRLADAADRDNLVGMLDAIIDLTAERKIFNAMADRFQKAER
jgi:hypothetical protein